jgi:hypothetical protein
VITASCGGCLRRAEWRPAAAVLPRRSGAETVDAESAVPCWEPCARFVTAARQALQAG